MPFDEFMYYVPIYQGMGSTLYPFEVEKEETKPIGFHISGEKKSKTVEEKLLELLNE